MNGNGAGAALCGSCGTRAVRRSICGRQRAATARSASATAVGSVIMRSWPVSISQNRPAARARAMRSGSRVATVDVQTMWYLGNARNGASSDNRNGCSKHPPGVSGQSVGHPGQVGGIGHAVEKARVGRREQHELDAVHDLAHRPHRFDDRTGDVDERLPVDWCRGVEVDDAPDPIGSPVADSGDHHAAVAVPDEDDVAQVFVVEHGGDVADVQVEIDGRTEKVRALAEAGERRRVHVVTVGPQEPRDALVAPTAVTAPVHQHIRRHRCDGNGRSRRVRACRTPGGRPRSPRSTRRRTSRRSVGATGRACCRPDTGTASSSWPSCLSSWSPACRCSSTTRRNQWWRRRRAPRSTNSSFRKACKRGASWQGGRAEEFARFRRRRR